VAPTPPDPIVDLAELVPRLHLRTALSPLLEDLRASEALLDPYPAPVSGGEA